MLKIYNSNILLSLIKFFTAMADDSNIEDDCGKSAYGEDEPLVW